MVEVRGQREVMRPSGQQEEPITIEGNGMGAGNQADDK